MSSRMYEITIPVSCGRYETLRTDRIEQLVWVKTGWLLGIAYGSRVENYYLDNDSAIRTPEGKLYSAGKFPMLSELLNLEKSLEEL